MTATFSLHNSSTNAKRFVLLANQFVVNGIVVDILAKITVDKEPPDE